MTTGVMTKSVENVDVKIDTTMPKTAEDLTEKPSSEVVTAEQTDPDAATVCDSIANDNGMLLNDITLEAEVVSFIDEYRDKELTDLEKPAIILSKLRTLYNAYSAKIERSGSITTGVLTKYGIRRGMLLNIEKKLLEPNGQQWIEHYTREYGGRSLRTAQDYMKLGNTPNILHYAVIGKERLMKILRAIRILRIESDDPIATLFQECGISFNPGDSHTEEKSSELKLAIDNAIAKSRIKKAEEKKGIELGVNLDHINNLIKSGVSVSFKFINDLFELESENRDVNSHLESLCADCDGGDELLPHINKVSALPKIVDSLKTTVESISQHSDLVKRVDQNSINNLERYVTELKNIYENQNQDE